MLEKGISLEDKILVGSQLTGIDDIVLPNDVKYFFNKFAGLVWEKFMVFHMIKILLIRLCYFI